MPSIELSCTFHAPIDQVFRALSDFENAPKIIPAITKVDMLTEGPVGVGTRFRETRRMFGREATETMEVTAFEPNSHYEISAESCGARFHARFRFQPEGSMTRVDVQTQVLPVTLMAKLMSPISFLMMGSMKKAMLSDLESVRKSLESVRKSLESKPANSS